MFQMKDAETFKRVKVLFGSDFNTEPTEGEEESGKEDADFGTNASFRPHQDFVDVMAALTDHALNALEIEVNNTNKKDFRVIGLKLDGNINLNQARVHMFLVKKIHREKSLYKLPATPPILLNDGGTYLTWKDLKKLILAVVKESEAYVNGKHYEDETPLPLQLAMTFKATAPKVKEEKKKIGRRTPKAEKVETPVIPSETPFMGAGAQA